MLTKREGALFVLCVLFAAFVATFGERRARWPSLALAGLAAAALAVPWRVWFVIQGLPGDGPSGGATGALDDPGRGWEAVELALETLVDPFFWLLAPVVAGLAILLGVLARAWAPSLYAVAFVLGAVGAASATIWSETSLPITQDDAVNPIVRMTGYVHLGADGADTASPRARVVRASAGAGTAVELGNRTGCVRVALAPPLGARC